MKLRNTIYIAALLQLFVLALPVEAKQQHHSSIYNLHEATKEEEALIKNEITEECSKMDNLDCYPSDAIHFFAKINLNDTEMLFYIVKLDSFSWCGKQGCPLDIWGKQKGRWMVIGDSVRGNSKLVKRCNKTRSGYHDLEYNNTILYWTGDRYKQKSGHCK